MMRAKERKGNMQLVKFNRWVDLLDRVAWTFVQAFAATLIVLGFNNWKDSLGAAAIAGAGAALKTVVSQNVGNSPLGDGVPGASVVETERQTGTTLSR
jgi:hypothetical protein